MFDSQKHWTMCSECKGQGKKSQRIKKKAQLKYETALASYIKGGSVDQPPIAPKGHKLNCTICQGSGLIDSPVPVAADTVRFPSVAIIGGGIGGVALAVACKHRGIPFTLYERDCDFVSRSQGYGLTLQQASKALSGYGIMNLNEGVISTRHIVHTPDGNPVGEWGMRKWLRPGESKPPKHTNIHIARQSLRATLLNQLDPTDCVKWNHQFVRFETNDGATSKLTFSVDGTAVTTAADLIVGADGIRSAVREQLLGEQSAPLRYLDCIVILGICPLSALDLQTELLDGATVFQTANGHERIYVMPYDADSVMWQLSFPMEEREAMNLSEKGAAALKNEAVLRLPWHAPIPEIIAATPLDLISGYPVYDRELLKPAAFNQAGPVTLIGDAAHPMSPFKGQGANQALLDALSLARRITSACRASAEWTTVDIREDLLQKFEREMTSRTASKVVDSAQAVDYLHSKDVLRVADEPRGKHLKTGNTQN